MKKDRRILSLWLPYAALSGWLMCFMRVCFQSVERTGLLFRQNALFIALCAGVVLGMLAPLPDHGRQKRKLRLLLCVSAIAAMPFTVLALYTQGAVALLCVLLASFAASTALGCCLYEIAENLKPGGFAMFFAAAFAASEGLLLVPLFLPAQSFPGALPAYAAALCLLLLSAVAAAYRSGTAQAAAPGSGAAQATAQATAPGAPPALIAAGKYLTALMLYCLLGGMLDNLTAFEQAFLAVPHMLPYVYLYSVGANLLLGRLFHRLAWPRLAMAGVLLICVGQTLPYFFSIAALAAPYLAFTITGVVIMEYLVRCLPVRYAAGSARPALYARLGYASLYGGFLAAGLIFEFLPRGFYFFVMGLVLLLSFAILSLLQSAYGEEENDKRAQLAAKLRELSEAAKERQQAGELHPLLTAEEIELALLLIEGKSRSEITRKLRLSAAEADGRMESIRDKISGIGDPDPAISRIVKAYGLTGRETHMLRCLRGGMTNSRIADELVLSEETVKKHIRSLMRKLPLDDRREIPAWLAAMAVDRDQ